MRQPFHFALLLLCPALFAIPAAAQTPAPPAPANPASANAAPQNTPTQPQAVLKATTRFVQVNVIVRDKNNKAIEGLKKEDFTVLDRGQAQNIAVFSLESGSMVPSAGAGAAVTPTLAPNIFTNRLDRGGQPPNVTIILFDALNTPIQDQIYARQQIIKVIGQLHPEDHAAIYLLTTKLEVLHEFTQDTRELLAALNKFHGQSSSFLDAATPSALSAGNVYSDMSQSMSAMMQNQPGMSAQSQQMMQNMQDMMQQFLNNADGSLMDFANVNRAETTANALEAIANHVARVPGRKSLVWVSGSFPIEIGFDGDTLIPIEREQRSFTKELEKAAEALNQASIAVYPVDARGLMTPAVMSAENRNAPVNTKSRTPLKNSDGTAVQFGPDQDEFYTMNMLADRTGGKAFYNNNDIMGGIRAAISDSESSYVLGFYPTNTKWDGKFHELKVRVNFHGAQVRYRKGYFAVPEATDKQAEAKAAVVAAAWSPVEATGVGLQVAVNPSGPPAPDTMELSVGIDLHDLFLENKDNHWNGNLDLVFLQMDVNGKLVGSEIKPVGITLDDKTYQSLLKQGCNIIRHLPIVANAATVRVLLRDSGSSDIGTVTIPVAPFLPKQAAAVVPPQTAPKDKGQK